MRARVLTSAILIPIVLAAITNTATWPCVALGFIIALLGSDEIHRLLGAEDVWRETKTHFPSPLLPAAVPIAPILTMTFPGPATFAVEVGVALFVLGVLAVWYAPRVRPGYAKIPILLLSGFWIGGPILCVVGLHELGNHTTQWNFHTPVALAVVPLWAGDIAAIFAGRAFGRHALAPTISPGKTWEGAIANFLACVLAGAFLGQWCEVGIPLGVACGAVAGVMGQLGDLFESAVKRAAGKKDSGWILPGHGGMMDRIDSILFTAPCVALILLVTQR